MIEILIITVLFFIFYYFYANLKSYLYIKREFEKKYEDYNPLISVIIPCKQVEEDFESNIKAILDMDYENVEYVFVTATSNENAYFRLKKIIRGNRKARLLVAGISDKRTQAVNNKIAGIKNARKESEILVIIDSDSHPDREFLKNLVKPLQDEDVGLTTGYRAYFPGKNFASKIRAVWNFGAFSFIDKMIYGGAFAFKRRFADKKLLDKLDRVGTEDFIILKHVKENQYKVKFVPECIVENTGEVNFKQLVSWTNRQTILMKNHYFELWLYIGLIMLSRVMLVSILILSLFGIIFSRFIGLIIFIFFISAESFGQGIIKREINKAIHRNFRISFIYSIFAFLLIIYNTIFSVFVHRFKWAGAEYRVKKGVTVIIIK